MKRHSKNNGITSKAGITSEVLAGIVATNLANVLVDEIFETIADEIKVTEPWIFGFEYNSYREFFYDLYKNRIESYEQEIFFDEETIDYLFKLSQRIPDVCIDKLVKRLNPIIRQWGFPEISCYYADKYEAKILNRNITSDAFVFFVSTKEKLDVGDMLGPWIVVERDSSGRKVRVSNGANEITLKLVSIEPEKDGIISEYCWIHVG